MDVRTSLVIVAAAMPAACSMGRPDLDTRTFELKYLRGGEASALISPYVYVDRPNGKGVFSVAGSMISVRETRDNLDKIARVLEEYDRPQPTVRLTFRLIEADGVPSVDPAIADVESVLRKLFRFRGYRLAAEGVVSGVEGSQVSQVLTGAAYGYEVGAEIDRVSGKGDSATVQLGVRLNLHPGAFMTKLGMPLGKTAVLGNVEGEVLTRAKTEEQGPRVRSRTLILTVRPELVSTSP